MRQHHDSGFVNVEVTQVGFADEDGAEGLIWMKSEDMRMFAMRAFSGRGGHAHEEVHRTATARRYRPSSTSSRSSPRGRGCTWQGVEVYPAGEALRADMQFMGKGKDLLLRGYRASDGIAMALFYDAPIMLQSSLSCSRREPRITQP